MKEFEDRVSVQLPTLHCDCFRTAHDEKAQHAPRYSWTSNHSARGSNEENLTSRHDDVSDDMKVPVLKRLYVAMVAGGWTNHIVGAADLEGAGAGAAAATVSTSRSTI